MRLGVLSRPTATDRSRSRPDSSDALVGGLGLAAVGGRLVRTGLLGPLGSDPLAYVEPARRVSRIRARAPTRIGGRVGRPEKAYHRAMQPNVHALFPVGEAGGPTRSLPEAARSTIRCGEVRLELGVRKCPCVRHDERLDPVRVRSAHRADRGGRHPYRAGRAALGEALGRRLRSRSPRSSRGSRV